jgi:formylglycine-generating enzyme
MAALRRLALLGALATGGGIALACGLDVSGSGAEATSDGGGTDDATVEGGRPDAPPPFADEAGADVVAAGDAGADAGRDAANPDACVAKHLPLMVKVAGVCIDTTEVTNSEYLDFIGAPDPPALTPECAWLKTFVPDAGLPPADLSPVLVNWCAAQAYCTWAGKRLCGKLGGGSLTANPDTEDPKKGQWAAACTNDGALTYPYGNTPDAGVCTSASMHPVEALAACQGPAPGLYDLSGNVWEWVDACNTGGAGGPTDDCSIMGGQFSSPDVQLKCRAHFTAKRNEVPYGATGFRCCGP